MLLRSNHGDHGGHLANDVENDISRTDGRFTEKQGENVGSDNKQVEESDFAEGQHGLVREVNASTGIETSEYPGAIALTLLMTGIFLAAIVTAIDRTIVATAIPTITDDFHSPVDVGWYGSAYMLTTCAFQPMYGRIYLHFDVRWSFLLALAIFELGSLVCATAPNSAALIVGRAIAGIGVAGLFSGAMVIISISMPPARRALMIGIIGGIFGLGSVAGPLLGGVFTTSLSWRWCFYINLPCGAVTLATLVIFFRPRKVANKGSFWERVLMLDLVGNLLIISTVVMLLLALQWGGTENPWNSALIIGLLVGASLEMFVFIAWQIYKGNDALIPPKIVSQRTVAAASANTFFLVGTLMVCSYYFPTWFQIIKGESAIQAGVHVIPLMATSFAFTAFAGAIVNKIGYFNPPAIVGPIIAMIGMGLLTTLQVDTSTAKWASFQVITAAGIGLAMQQGLMAVQVVLSSDELAIGISLILFASPLSGSIFISVGNSIIRNSFAASLRKAALPDVNIPLLLSVGVTEVVSAVPKKDVAEVLLMYHRSLVKVFVLCIPLLGLSFLSAIPMEWKKIEDKQVESQVVATEEA